MPTDRILIFDPTPDGPARKTAGSLRTSPTARELELDIPHAFNCDFRFSLIFLSQAKSIGCKRKKIQFP